MAWLPKIAMVFSVGIAAAQQCPVVVDPESELTSMLQEWRQQNRGNPEQSREPAPAAAEASAKPGSCVFNGKTCDPCPPLGSTIRKNEHTPLVLSAMQPEYPNLAAASTIRGHVVVLVTIDPNGSPRDPKVITVSARDASGQPTREAKTFGFDQAALAAVRNWIFAPGTKDGVPISAKLVIEINFPALY